MNDKELYKLFTYIVDSCVSKKLWSYRLGQEFIPLADALFERTDYYKDIMKSINNDLAGKA